MTPEEYTHNSSSLVRLKMAHKYCRLHFYMVFYIKLFIISVHFLSTQANTSNETIDCFLTPKSVAIKCRTVNAGNWTCIKNNEISVPQTPENKNFSINCTAPYPIDVDINGIQLNDNYTTYFVRNAENIYNEATFVYSIAIPCGSFTAPRRFTIRRFSDSNVETTFYMLRPGTTYFDKNIVHSSYINNIIPVARRSKNVIIPCVVNDANVSPTLFKKTGESETNEITKNYPFEYTSGFSLNDTDPTGTYFCRGSNNEEVQAEVLPLEEFIAEPKTKDVLLFVGGEVKVYCMHKDQVTLKGFFKGEDIGSRVQTKISSYDQFKYLSEFYVNDVLEGDTGNISCVSSTSEKILHTWRINTVDVKRNPILNLTHIDKNMMSCQSSLPDPKISALFCQGISNCKLLNKCLENKMTSCPNVIEGTPCLSNGGSCLNFTEDRMFSQGMIICSAGNYTYKTNYIRGFDGILYPNWELAPLDALIDVKLPKGQLFPQKSYPFGCRASKFISDGKLQWVIRGKDGSEILLHKGRVQDLYGVFSGLDYDLHTTRESNIRLIYPNDYDILCLVPQWNGTASLRNHKRISVEEKPTKVKEISIGAGVAIFLLIVPLVYVMWRLKIAKDALRNLTDAEVDEFLKGNPEILKSLQGKEAHEMVDSLPYNPEFEIPREKLLIDTDNVLGSGAFGTVLKGKLEGIDECVAVKTVKSKCEIDHFKGFLSELKIMMYIGSHPNIVTLIGAYTEKIREKTLFIVVELCTLGSMEGFLRNRRSHFCNQITNDEIVPSKEAPLMYQNVTTIANGHYENSMKTIDLVVWSYQIANGMDYLASKKVVHADLAARNVLLHANGTAKITDFGLSRQLFDYGMYVKKQQEPLPWRWMAIESLQRLNFSTQSDVWAYGVLLWEIFSLGDVPYPGLTWTISFVEELCNGLRMIKPTYATNSIYKIMFDCWKEDVNERPTFRFIKEYFRSMMLTLELDVEKIDSAASKPCVVKLKGTQDSSEDRKSNRHTNIYL